MTAHHRVCGEDFSAQFVEEEDAGSSPQVRGKHLTWRRVRIGRGLIPAGAGKTLNPSRSRAHPRFQGPPKCIRPLEYGFKDTCSDRVVTRWYRKVRGAVEHDCLRGGPSHRTQPVAPCRNCQTTPRSPPFPHEIACISWGKGEAVRLAGPERRLAPPLVEA